MKFRDHNVRALVIRSLSTMFRRVRAVVNVLRLNFRGHFPCHYWSELGSAWVLTAGCLVFAVGMLTSASAHADTPITSFSAVPSTTQAGGHPDVEIAFGVDNRQLQGSRSACNCEDAEDSTVHLPAGVIGNPRATPQCSIAEFSTESCPVDSQVGIVFVDATPGINFDSALYNLIPPPDEVGLTGFKIYGSNTPQFTVLSARTGGDFGLNATAASQYHGEFPLQEIRQDLWGVPADPSHNALRLKTKAPGDPTTYLGNVCDDGVVATNNPNTFVEPCETDFVVPPPAASDSPLTPFLQNPTDCEAPLGSSLEVLSYDGGLTNAQTEWPQVTGCDQLSFNPSLTARPTTEKTDSASGIEVDLTVPQQLSAEVPSPSELHAATVTLPPGFSINPGAADGKTVCTDAEARFGTEEEAQCPEFARVGSLTIESSALPGSLPGSVYLGEPLPGNRYRIFLVANGFATHVKLPGTVSAAPETGQLSITFANLPQTPLTAFDMHFFGSERGLLATPTRCGTYPVTSTFTPWDETIGTQTSTQYFTLNSGPNGTSCPGAERPFHPGFEAGSTRNQGGEHTPFFLQLTRDDGEQNLSALSVTTPPGFLATLKGIPYCPESALVSARSPMYSGLDEESNPSCPVNSQVGTSDTGSGAGTHPLYTAGRVYLSGPYKGAPLSLAVITPAIAGPYDLGNVVVRVGIHINPETAQITATSDPLPEILEGIPLRLREIRLNLNRPDFTVNPTNCDPFSMTSEILGEEGALTKPSGIFQVADCRALSFGPSLTIGFKGSSRRAGNPALIADLNYSLGRTSANIASTSVILPPTVIIDNAHIKNPCTKVMFAEGSNPGERCPAGSIIGHAKAESPLLDSPLEGPVYLRSAPENKNGLPDIVAALNGQIDLTLDGKISTVDHGKRIRTTFAAVPDAPVSRFMLSLDGSSKGLLQNSSDLCSASEPSHVEITAQNGKAIVQSSLVQTACRPAAKRHDSHVRSDD